MNPDRPIVAFDFDGTLSTVDSFVLFLRYIAPGPQFWLNLAAALPAFAVYPIRRDRHELKQALSTVFLKNGRVEDIAPYVERFVANVLPRIIRPGALDAIAAHKRDGHRVLLVSASPALYLEPWAKAHGFEATLATQLEVRNGTFTGRIEGRNCRGAEKVRRISAYIGHTPILAAAYGDSAGDTEMLALATTTHFKPFRH
jgi:phosphatidylglycerophosphatase C